MHEVADAAGEDPLAFQPALLSQDARAQAVLEKAAEMAKTVMERDRVTVPRVFAAMDCGRAINPGEAEAQVSGSIIDALGPTLRAKITLQDGPAVQSNFYDYELIRMDEAPEIAFVLVDSGAHLGGAGEPPLAGAVCNAVFAANGRRIRSLPLFDHGLA